MENPQAVWYIRLASGDQYGPAKGDEIQRWLDENRVTPDSLVWREDWPDWKRAETVFPKFRAPAPAPAPTHRSAPTIPNLPALNIPAPGMPGSGMPGMNPAMAAPVAAAPVMAAPAMPLAARPVAAVPISAVPVAAVPVAQAESDSSDTIGFLKRASGGAKPRSEGDEEKPKPRKRRDTGLIVLVSIMAILLVVLLGGIAYLSLQDRRELTFIVTNVAANIGLKMPSRPVQATPGEPVPTKAGPIRMQDFVDDLRASWGYSFFFIYADGFKSADAQKDVPGFFDEVVPLVAKKFNSGDVASQRGMSLGGSPGREYYLRGGQQARIRMFLVNDKLYVIGVATNDHSLQAEVIESYFRSFHLLSSNTYAKYE